MHRYNVQQSYFLYTSVHVYLNTHNLCIYTYIYITRTKVEKNLRKWHAEHLMSIQHLNISSFRVRTIFYSGKHADDKKCSLKVLSISIYTTESYSKFFELSRIYHRICQKLKKKKQQFFFLLCIIHNVKIFSWKILFICYQKHLTTSEYEYKRSRKWFTSRHLERSV